MVGFSNYWEHPLKRDLENISYLRIFQVDF